MDPIIRAAAVSPTSRQLRRPVAPQRAPAATAAPLAPVTPLARPAPEVPQPATLPPNEERLAASLRERELEIDKLRAQAGKAQLALTEAYDDAERRGHAAGMEKGQRAGQELLQVQAERLKSVVTQLGQARALALAEAEDTLVEIAFAAVCKFVGEQGVNRAALERIVAHAAAGVRTREQLAVRLHPEDLALLQSGAAMSDAGPRLLADPAVKLGGCIVDNASGSLDARFETQLALLAETLRAARAVRNPGGEAL